MAAALAILGGLFGLLLIRHIRCILAIRSLHRQLAEMERGSHMELGAQIGQRDILNLCRGINRLERHWFREQMQHEKAEKQLKQNITGLAHDIRTPLTGAAGYVQLAQECREPERQERYLKTADSRLKELGDMLEELFLYTKLASKEFEFHLSEVQVLPLVGECLVEFYCQFEEKGMAPVAEFETEGLRVLADEECLRRIFHNLIQNALLHGRGDLVVRQRGRSLTFENLVSETSRPDPVQIFEPFYKADQARRKGSSGLGLFIVKELAGKMGWSVEAGMEGERFWVTVVCI